MLESSSSEQAFSILSQFYLYKHVLINKIKISYQFIPITCSKISQWIAVDKIATLLQIYAMKLHFIAIFCPIILQWIDFDQITTYSNHYYSRLWGKCVYWQKKCFFVNYRFHYWIAPAKFINKQELCRKFVCTPHIGDK